MTRGGDTAAILDLIETEIGPVKSADPENITLEPTKHEVDQMTRFGNIDIGNFPRWQPPFPRWQPPSWI